MSKKKSVRRSSAASGQISDDFDSEDDVPLMPPKRSKEEWQQTLLNLVAAQQQQLSELIQQNKMATSPVPTPSNTGTDTSSAPASTSAGTASAHASTSAGHANAAFKLTRYDPDKSAYSVKEWLDDADKLKEELNISDILMIAKAGEALENRGYQYFCNWRPLSRTWNNFCNDLTIAFPDRETPGARAYMAATLRSHDCESLCDYGLQKLRSIKRFHNQLPWDTILSMVEYGLDYNDARSAVQIQKPTSERELMKLLSDFDARRLRSAKSKHQELGGSTWKTERRSKERDRAGGRSFRSFKGACFKCGRQGHQQDACRQLQKENPSKDVANEKPQPSSVPFCNHCKKMGHTESTCYYKQKPKTAFVMKK